MTEKRIEPRLLCSELVELAQLNSRRGWQTQIVNLEDISPSGACVQTDLPLTQHLPVVIYYADGELPGLVRHSYLRDGAYFSGIEFSSGCKWAVECFEPEYLLDPRQVSPMLVNVAEATVLGSGIVSNKGKDRSEIGESLES